MSLGWFSLRWVTSEGVSLQKTQKWIFLEGLSEARHMELHCREFA